MKKLINEFKAFCAKGNILELATGMMIGSAFTTIVNSLVNDVLMPVIGILTGGLDMSGLFIPLDFQFGQYANIDAAKAAGVGTLNYGAFLQAMDAITDTPYDKHIGEGFAAQVYKIRHDAQGARQVYFKVTAGTLRVKEEIATPAGSFKINDLKLRHGGKSLREFKFSVLEYGASWICQ